MRNRKGFTLIELMVVILIVGILAAVAIPLMRGRVDSAKWSEGKAVAGTIATALRAYAAENGGTDKWVDGDQDLTALGFTTGDLTGTYFTSDLYSCTAAYDATAATPLTFTITVTKPAAISTGSDLTLDQTGTFSGGPQ